MGSRICMMAALATICCASALAQEAPAEGAQPESPTRNGLHVIGPDDTLLVHSFACEDISRGWRVRTSGDLNLPLVGNVKAAGLTLDEFETLLLERLRKFYHEPQVSVTLSEVRSRPVTVTGAVGKPGAFQLSGTMTLLDVLLMAGGTKDAGDNIVVTRSIEEGRIGLPAERLTADGRFSTIELETTQVENSQTAAANLIVRPNDVITVPVKKPRLVYIIGEVARPGAVELVNQHSVSITKLVATANGFTRQASPGKTLIRHIDDDGATRGDTAIIDLKKVMSGEVADLELGEGDVVIVPTSQWMTYVQTISQSAVNAGVYAILATF